MHMPCPAEGVSGAFVCRSVPSRVSPGEFGHPDVGAAMCVVLASRGGCLREAQVYQAFKHSRACWRPVEGFSGL